MFSLFISQILFVEGSIDSAHRRTVGIRTFVKCFATVLDMPFLLPYFRMFLMLYAPHDKIYLRCIKSGAIKSRFFFDIP